MFGIFNHFIRTSTRTDTWNAPAQWTDTDHWSSYERQRREAADHRMRLAREKTML